MKKELIIYKGRRGLYNKFLERLYEAWKKTPEASKREYLKHSEFRKIIPRSFQIKKYDAREILLIFHDLGFVSIEKRGIKLNFEVKDGRKNS
jgi:hypothetical protein